jgi:hypothetical protein
VARKLQRAHALGRQEQDRQQLGGSVRQQLGRQRIADLAEARIRTQQVWSPADARDAQRLLQPSKTLNFFPGFRLSGTVRSHKQGVLDASRLLHVRHHELTRTRLFACTRRAAVGRRGRRTPMRRTRSSAQRAEPGACAIASSLASVESSALAAGGAASQAPRHSSTSTACPTACARAR